VSSDPVVIVSGLPRSGTSLMMQMLEAGGLEVLTDARRSPDEDNPRGYYELEAVKTTSTDPSWLRDAPGRAVKVVEMLLAHLPGDLPCTVLLMDRDLTEVVRSQRAMLERSGRTGAALGDEALITAYCAQRARTLAMLEARDETDVLVVNHGSLLMRTSETCRSVASFVGGLDAEAMAAVVDPALYRQRAD